MGQRLSARWWWIAPGTYPRTCLEALVIGGFITGVLSLIQVDFNGLEYLNAYIYTMMLTTLIFALRLSLASGGWWRRLLYEVAVWPTILFMAWLLVRLALMLLQPQSREMILNTPEWTQSNMAAEVVGLIFFIPQAIGARIIKYGWAAWNNRRQKSLVWELTHGYLMVLVGFFAVLLIALLFVMQFNTADTLAGSVLFGLGSSITVTSWLVIGLTVLVLGPSIGIAYFISRQIARRLQHLTDATSALQAGDTTTRIVVEGQDEVAHLQRSFNAMADALDRSLHDLEVERDRVAALLESRRELFAGISHDLRTPVTTLQATLEATLAHHQADLPPDVQHDLTLATSNLTHLQQLIEDLFTAARSEVDQLDIQLEALDVGPVLQRIADSATASAWQKREIKLVTLLADDIPQIQADVVRLEQVVNNLIQNALRHTPPGGLVALSASADAETVRISVADTGDGIAPEDLAHIWDRWYRAGQNRQPRPAHGAGLGLSLVKELVERMGGTVEVESKVGAGSKFTLIFPRLT